MKRIVAIFCLLISALFFCQPQADAFGGAVAVIPINNYGYPLYLEDDDPFRQELVDTYKQYVPEGYNVYCSRRIEYDFGNYCRSDDSIMAFAKSAGYDFIIEIRIFPANKPDVVHFQHPIATFDFYDTSADIFTWMYSIHDDQVYRDNLCREYHGSRGETLEQAQHAALHKTIDANAAYFGRKIMREVLAQTQPAVSNEPEPGPMDFVYSWVRKEL